MAIQFEVQHLGVGMRDALEKLRRGEEITITDQGQAVARLVAVEPRKSVFGAFNHQTVIAADDFDDALPPGLLAELE